MQKNTNKVEKERKEGKGERGREGESERGREGDKEGGGRREGKRETQKETETENTERHRQREGFPNPYWLGFVLLLLL